MEDICNFKPALSKEILRIGAFVKEKRILKKMTQQDLSFYCSCERATISNIERGNCDNISLKTIIKISTVLEIEIKDFFK